MKDARMLLLSVAACAIALVAKPAVAAEYEWNYISVVTVGHNLGGAINEAFERIEKKSDGRLKITFVNFSETPHKSTNALAVLRDGLTQMTEWIPAYYSGTYPILGAPSLPFLAPGSPDTAEVQAAADAMWEAPAMKGEVEAILGKHKGRELGSYYYEPMNLYFDTVVNAPKEMKGLRVRIFNPELAAFVESYGATPVNLPAPDVYSSLQRGMLDGVVTSSGGVVGLKWHEQLEAGYLTNLTMIRTGILVSEEALAELPEDLRTLLIEEMAATGDQLRRALTTGDAANHEQMKELGFTLVDATDEQYAAMRELAAENLWPAWVERTGGEAQTVLDSILASVGTQ